MVCEKGQMFILNKLIGFGIDNFDMAVGLDQIQVTRSDAIDTYLSSQLSSSTKQIHQLQEHST